MSDAALTSFVAVLVRRRSALLAPAACRAVDCRPHLPLPPLRAPMPRSSSLVAVSSRPVSAVSAMLHQRAAIENSNKNIDLYAVNYPADTQVDIGANDMSQRILYMINNCPNTRLVLGGYSLGAAVDRHGARTSHVDFIGLQDSAAGRRGHAHRGCRAVRQRVPMVGPDLEFQPRLPGPDHRAVPWHRSDLQPRPTRIPGRTTGPITSPTLIMGPGWSIRLPTSSQAGSSLAQTVRRSRVTLDAGGELSWGG